MAKLNEIFQKLADYLQNKNKYQCAEKLIRESLNICKANHLPNHPDIGDSMNNLASVL